MFSSCTTEFASGYLSGSKQCKEPIFIIPPTTTPKPHDFAQGGSCSWTCALKLPEIAIKCGALIDSTPLFAFCAFNELGSCKTCICDFVCKYGKGGSCGFCHSFFGGSCGSCIGGVGNALKECKDQDPANYLKCAIGVVSSSSQTDHCKNDCLCDSICSIPSLSGPCNSCHKKSSPNALKKLNVDRLPSGVKSDFCFICYPSVCVKNSLKVKINYEIKYGGCSHDSGSTGPGGRPCHSRGLCLVTE